MHELSIAMSLVEAASEKAESLGDVRVEALHVRIGPLSGVVKEALEFSFELAAKGTPIEGARLAIEEVPLTLFCGRCQDERVSSTPLSWSCPVCGEPAPRIVRGKELELHALEVSDHARSDR